MYEELFAPIPDLDAYLARIGMKREDVTHDETGLTALVRAHVGHIPFDDMDVWGPGICPSLSVEDLYNKVIVRKRGGYCFELNSLFRAFLRDLGFEVYCVMIHSVRGRDYVAPALHCAVIVTIDGMKYFTDVGYGGPAPYGAVAFDGLVHHGFFLREEQGYMLLCDVQSGETVPAMLFRDAAAQPVDFITPNFYVSQDRPSIFRNRLMLNLRNDEGIFITNDNEFKIARPDGSHELRTLETMDELKQVLTTYYGIDPAEATLREHF